MAQHPYFKTFAWKYVAIQQALYMSTKRCGKQYRKQQVSRFWHKHFKCHKKSCPPQL